MLNTKAFARWLRERREEVNPRLTQRRLAEEAGVSSYYVNRLEANGTPNCSQPIDQPGEDKVDALARALEKYHGRPLVNEARRVLGYVQLAGEPEPTAQRTSLADGPPSAERGDLAMWAVRLPHDTRSWLREYLGELDRLGVSQPFAMG